MLLNKLDVFLNEIGEAVIIEYVESKLETAFFNKLNSFVIKNGIVPFVYGVGTPLKDSSFISRYIFSNPDNTAFLLSYPLNGNIKLETP